MRNLIRCLGPADEISTRMHPLPYRSLMFSFVISIFLLVVSIPMSLHTYNSFIASLRAVESIQLEHVNKMQLSSDQTATTVEAIRHLSLGIESLQKSSMVSFHCRFWGSFLGLLLLLFIGGHLFDYVIGKTVFHFLPSARLLSEQITNFQKQTETESSYRRLSIIALTICFLAIGLLALMVTMDPGNISPRVISLYVGISVALVLIPISIRTYRFDPVVRLYRRRLAGGSGPDGILSFVGLRCFVTFKTVFILCMGLYLIATEFVPSLGALQSASGVKMMTAAENYSGVVEHIYREKSAIDNDFLLSFVHLKARKFMRRNGPAVRNSISVVRHGVPISIGVLFAFMLIYTAIPLARISTQRPFLWLASSLFLAILLQLVNRIASASLATWPFISIISLLIWIVIWLFGFLGGYLVDRLSKHSYSCPRCQASEIGGARYCSQCGLELGSVGPPPIILIGNRNSRELHSSSCPYVKCMKSCNIVIIDGFGRAYDLGYNDCARCLPGHFNRG